MFFPFKLCLKWIIVFYITAAVIGTSIPFSTLRVIQLNKALLGYFYPIEIVKLFVDYNVSDFSLQHIKASSFNRFLSSYMG